VVPGAAAKLDILKEDIGADLNCMFMRSFYAAEPSGESSTSPAPWKSADDAWHAAREDLLCLVRKYPPPRRKFSRARETLRCSEEREQERLAGEDMGETETGEAENDNSAAGSQRKRARCE
jgi:hypothetical protein